MANAERQAIVTMERELKRHFDLASLVHQAIGTAVNLMPDNQVPVSARVCTALLCRLSNDIECASKLATQGYPMQAATIASAMYEVAYTIVSVGSDDIIAGKWAAHDDPCRSFETVYRLTELGTGKIAPILHLSGAERANRVRSQYKVYRQLCMAKHSSRLLQQGVGHQVEQDTIIARNGADASEGAVRVAWFAMEQAICLACLACASFVESHLAAENRGNLMLLFERIFQERDALIRCAAERWGTEDPFPDKW